MLSLAMGLCRGSGLDDCAFFCSGRATVQVQQIPVAVGADPAVVVRLEQELAQLRSTLREKVAAEAIAQDAKRNADVVIARQTKEVLLRPGIIS